MSSAIRSKEKNRPILPTLDRNFTERGVERDRTCVLYRKSWRFYVLDLLSSAFALLSTAGWLFLHPLRLARSTRTKRGMSAGVLTLWTKEGASSNLHDAADLRATLSTQLSRTVVHF